MSFYLPVGAREFFGIRNGRPFATTEVSANRFIIFDAFSCCMLLGLDKRQYGEDDHLEARNFLDGYPDTHRSQAVIYAGLLVDAELARKDIAPQDRTSIEREMITLLDLTSPTRLSETGDKLLNLYAASGFARMRSAISPPANLEDFLIDYADLWKAADTSTTDS